MKTSKMVAEDTIAAIATPLGEGGVGLIRVSGPEAPQILRKLFRPNRAIDQWESHRLYVGEISLPGEGTVLDRGMAVWMKSPRSYTGEEVIEFHLHGGPLSIRRILERVIASGARLAEPGEFTKRAFLNGKIDLAQAEAVADLVSARTERFLEEARNRLHGGFSEKINAVRQEIVHVLSRIEAALDFPDEEEVGRIQDSEVGLQLQRLIEQLRRMLQTYEEGRRIREGIDVTILGRPNVGKSSLLNQLLGFERAIVSEVPGTTRDTIEETVSWSGIGFRIADTAGIRTASNRIEEEGVERAWRQAEAAQLVLVVLDGSERLTEVDQAILDRLEGVRSMVVVNKVDLPQAFGVEQLRSIRNGRPILRVSALRGEGIDRLREALVEVSVGERRESANDVMITVSRHKVAIENGLSRLVEADRALRGALPLELVAAELRGGLDAIGEIVGLTTNDEILNDIFSRFCIGK